MLMLYAAPLRRYTRYTYVSRRFEHVVRQYATTPRQRYAEARIRARQQ